MHELRELTPTLRECIADLLNSVETQGRWPTSLPGPLGILLPKSGTEDPMDRRPIWLMPMTYRMWAGHRAGIWSAWRLQWHGETPFEGADSLAWETSLHQEAALGRGDAFAMVALDWKKAYDGITLDILGQTLQAAGVPTWASGPLLGMYASKRRLRVGRVIGPEWKPTSGIPAGCPTAVFALAVCTHLGPRW